MAGLAVWSILLMAASSVDLELPNVRIVFTGGMGMDPGDIFLLESLDGKPINLTQHPSPDYFPRWSPDGRRVAFLSRRDGDEELYVMDLTTRRLKRITRRFGPDAFPAWSPDGRSIAVLSHDIWLKVRLIDLATGRFRFLTDGRIVGPFDWTPEGKLLIGCKEPKGFYLLDVESGELERIPIPHDLDFIHSLDCSRDGRKVVYEATVGRVGGSYIYVMDLVDGTVRNLSKLSGRPASANDSYPRWTPDGRFIVFASDRDPNKKGFDLYIMTDEGEIVKRLDIEGYAYQPDVFDPDYAYPVPLLDLMEALWGEVKGAWRLPR